MLFSWMIPRFNPGFAVPTAGQSGQDPGYVFLNFLPTIESTHLCLSRLSILERVHARPPPPWPLLVLKALPLPTTNCCPTHPRPSPIAACF
jgi:hypothetical protein